MPRVFDTPSLEVECLDNTVPEAEMTKFCCMRIPREFLRCLNCEFPKPWAELALIYMQGRLNDQADDAIMTLLLEYSTSMENNVSQKMSHDTQPQ